MLSIVVPVRNEEPVILPLYDRLTTVLEQTGRTYEIIFVDDASTDQGFNLLANLVETDSRLTAIRLRRKFGPTAAVAAGFDEAHGEAVVAFDGGPRHDPDDIPRLVSKLEEGYDVVSIRNSGTALKAYRAEILKDISLYSELHRFPSLLAGFYAARVAELPAAELLKSRRGKGYWKNGFLQAFFDKLACKLLLSYLARPMHAVGRWGAVAAAIGGLLFAAWWIEQLTRAAMAESAVQLFAAALLCFGGVMFFCTGLVGEILMRTYFESQRRRIYKVREVRARRERVTNGAR